MKSEVTCPKCKKKYTPYGAFMLEKCYCPNCGYVFHVLKGAQVIRILYSVITFVMLILVYDIIRPETSLIIAAFWIGAMLLLKAVTYVTHIILWAGWSLIGLIHRRIYRQP